jgi:hypothetical protein
VRSAGARAPAAIFVWTTCGCSAIIAARTILDRDNRGMIEAVDVVEQEGATPLRAAIHPH